MTKTPRHARTARVESSEERPAADPRPTTTVDDLLFEARAVNQRHQLLLFLAQELDAAFGPSCDPGDPPLPLPSPTGALEKPIRGVVEELHAELLAASRRAHARYRRLMASPAPVELEPLEPLFDVEASG